MKNSYKIKAWVAAAILLALSISFLSACGSEKNEKDIESDKSFKRSTSSGATSSRLNNGNTSDPKAEKASEESASAQKNDKTSFSLSTDDKSAKLPKGYPSDIFPLYEGVFIVSVLENQGSYVFTAYSKDDVKKVMAFYEKVLKGAKEDMETRMEESLTSMGSVKGYSYMIDVAKTNEQGYKTSISISLQPQK